MLGGAAACPPELESALFRAAGNTLALTTTDRTNGNAVVTLNQLGYDALNRVITATVYTNTASIPGSAQTTLTRYDLDGNVAQTQQPNGDVVYNVYDAADRLTTVEIDPAPLTKGQAATHPSYEAYGYDAAGNQTVAQDADNRATTTQYDGDNRATQSVAASTAPTGTTTITTTMGYDPDGNTARQTTQTVDSTTPGQVQTHTLTSTYNAADWETSTSDDGYTTAYGYDAAGQRRTETIIDGVTPVTMQLDAEGRVTSIGEGYGGVGPYTAQYAYNADDLPTTVTLPNGVSKRAGYDANSALTSLTATRPNMGTITNTLNTAYGYGYNAAGWTTSTTTISGTDTVAHDGVGRLTDEAGTQVDNPTHAYHWAYDPNGNVTAQTADLGTTESYAYSPTQPNTLLQTHAPGYLNPDTYYSYDSNGDTTSITSPITGSLTAPGAINTHIGYDARQRVMRVAHQDNKPFVATVAYNAEGDRARYTVVTSGTTTMDEQFQYRDGQIAQVSAVTATVNATGTVTSRGNPYIDSFVYRSSGEPLEFLRQQGGVTSRYWFVLDGQGNVVAVTDKNGAVVDRYNYDSWGEPIGKDYQTVPQQLRYAGYWYDSEVQWYWLSVRYYDPELMRFLQPDPSGIDGVHSYAYVADDPIDAIDPTGLCELLLHRASAGGTSFYHTYITVTENSKKAPALLGITNVFEGVPEHEGILLGRSGSTGYGKLIASTPSHPETKGVHGDAYANHGNNRRATIANLQYGDTKPCKCYIDKFKQIAATINSYSVAYNPLTTNSNAVAYTYANQAILAGRPDNVANAPGWGYDLVDIYNTLGAEGLAVLSGKTCSKITHRCG